MSLGPFDILFTPFTIRNTTFRNRFVMPAMQRGFVANGVPSDRMIEYLRARGEGGVGLIISEGSAPNHPSGYWQDVLCMLTPEHLPQWEKLIVAVKSTGAKFFQQIWHPGALREVAEHLPQASYPTLSPSGLIQKGRPSGRAATYDELQEIKAAYVQGAINAGRLGADGVELHACHGYFLDQFLWHETNIREDMYGGATLAERARFPAEIAAAIRAEVGRDFIISFRFSQFKEADYTARIAETPEDLRDMLAVMRKAGVDVFNVSARRFYQPAWPERNDHLGFAGWAKSLTDAAVISVGSVGLDKDWTQDLLDNQDPGARVLRDLQEVARCVEAGEFDLIGVGRTQIANWDFVKKVREGRLDEIQLFKKSQHLADFVDGWEIGAVAEYRVTEAH